MATVSNWNYLPNNLLTKIFSNLSQISRGKASATCRTWRQAFLTPCLWDDVQLCFDSTHGWERSKKFASSYGWIFRRVAIFPLLFRLNMFDMNGFLLYDAAEKYERAIQELPELLDLMAACKGVRRLRIKFPDDIMGSWGDDFGVDFFPEELQERIWQSICSILKSSTCIENLELGFHIDLLGEPKRLQELKDNSCQTLKTLHCTAVDCTFNPTNPWCPPSINVLKAFKKLREIHLNISYVTDDLLEALSAPDRCPVERISILSTCIEKEVEDGTWTSDAKWENLKTHSPNLQVSISIYWPDVDNFKHWLKPVIPLYNLSVVCDDENLDITVVSYLKSHFKDTLISLGFHCSSALSLFQHERMRLYSQPLVELTVYCQQLKQVVITGFEIFYEDIISVAESRKDLEILDIAHDSIIYMDPERGDRSSDLGADWVAPRDNNEESPDERENREQRDNRKIQLINRVSDAFQSKWNPMNRETTAFSYWGFLDENLLPYQEVTDDDDVDGKGDADGEGTSEGTAQSTSDASESESSSKSRTDQDTNDDDGSNEDSRPCEDRPKRGDVGHHENTTRASRNSKRESYQEYYHAIHLAPRQVAYRVKPNYRS
ncbi:F-box only protein 33-like [Amphiura filiformis]|uniref:F-box only protein 33-like n=1 Tax=Amphiura filiformis TaxID=82378 RepID=UPI003B21C16B